MAIEVCSYRLTLRGKPAGSEVLRTHHRGRTTHLEARLLLQGGRGQIATTQQSQLHRNKLFSYRFLEITDHRGVRRSFEVIFDRQSGLVKGIINFRDRATVPYLKSYRDPLSLLHQIRNLDDAEEIRRIPLLGKDVTVKSLGVTPLDTTLGKREARAYLLYPGGSYVYVDTTPPHLILELRQRLDGHYLDAQLVKIEQEHKELVWESSSTRPPRQRSARRRRRRRKAGN